MKTVAIIAVMLTSAAFGFAHAGTAGTEHSIQFPEARVELKAGEGKERVDVLCNICHSLDYITMQPRVARAQWTATVNKMIKVMGAPINEDDAKKIIDYLVANYGTGT